ncbi:cell division protein FtsK [Halobacillus salinus]|uniref:Cell division protein FtsK n=1 Tax=Halobacillus salinus TaxID=192814 RepID=A0A4Z0H2A4_9BACI|nr:cell division protein FtsK [Halobacillus salinus]TGB03536.1 cell division protein FtsK [Halobacillus salinus]
MKTLWRLLVNSKLNKMFSEDDLTQAEKDYINSIPSQNSLGIITLLLGGAGFMFGNNHLWIAIISVTFGTISLRTFDKKEHDNPWPFYIGILLGLIGIVLNLTKYSHMAV